MIKPTIICNRKINLPKKSAVIRKSLNSGFTLVELLIAASLSVFVIGGAAFGVTAMMQRNAILEARSQRRMELDRAINYIADDIKQANCVRIVKPSSKDCKGTDIKVTFAATIKNPTVVLLLMIPPATPATSNTSNRLYFIAASTPTWVSPNTIYRYEGTIASNDITVTESDDITRSNANELIDGITAPSDTQLKEIKDLCPTEGFFQGANGFYACINEATNTVDLYLYGKLQDDPTQENENLLVTTRVSARGTP